ncbi:MAG: hypothetical protein ACOC8E_05770, partial [Planctomycetota bacterium]
MILLLAVRDKGAGGRIEESDRGSFPRVAHVRVAAKKRKKHLKRPAVPVGGWSEGTRRGTRGRRSCLLGGRQECLPHCFVRA